MIEQLKQTQDMLAKLLALLEAGEADKFAAHLTMPAVNTDAPASDRTRTTRLIEQSLGIEGDFRPWEHLLRVHEQSSGLESKSPAFVATGALCEEVVASPLLPLLPPSLGLVGAYPAFLNEPVLVDFNVAEDVQDSLRFLGIDVLIISVLLRARLPLSFR